MSLKEMFVERGRRVLSRPEILRWATDDRVMRAAQGVMDARGRVKAAWQVLINGHDLPAVDPALDERIVERAVGLKPSHGVLPGNGPPARRCRGGRGARDG